MRASILALIIGLSASTTQAAEPQAAMQAFLEANIKPWADDAALVSAIVAQNAVTGDYDAAHIDALDKQWRAEVGSASALIDGVLTNAAADFLRHQIEASGGIITEVFIMDGHGLNVAASAATSDYWQGDEDKFQKTHDVGPAAVHFSEIEFDESSQSYQAQISLTIVDPASGAPIGAMTVGINADALM